MKLFLFDIENKLLAIIPLNMDFKSVKDGFDIDFNCEYRISPLRKGIIAEYELCNDNLDVIWSGKASANSLDSDIKFSDDIFNNVIDEVKFTLHVPKAIVKKNNWLSNLKRKFFK